MKAFREFFFFWRGYILRHLFAFGKQFEQVKNVIVALLIVKRGKYSSSFLNSTFFLLVVAAIVGGPIIAENNPFSTNISNEAAPTQQVFGYDPYENSLRTNFSIKPRDKVEDYKVKNGDTLAGISKKFSVSVDTIKWANDLDSDTIKPNETLKIPPGTGIVHEVDSGDSIYSIAKKYNVDAQAIANFPFNDFADLDTFAINTGSVLFVPNGSIKEAAPIQQQSPGGFYTGPIQAGARGSSNFIWPTSGGVTQYPIWYHMALDIANNGSPPILASDTGTVTYAGCINWGYGCHVIIDHGNGYSTLYGHLSSLQTNAGQVVPKGQQLGLMGSTGRSTGIHLHFEIRSSGTLLNPLEFLQ